MISNRSVPASTVLPHVAYPDVTEAAAWLAKTFGFSEHYRYGEPGGPVGGVQMQLGNAFVKLRRAGNATPEQLGFGTQSLTIFVEEVEEHCENAKATGAEIVEELHETPYGELQYGARDLAGHHWLFSRHARDVSPQAWGATVLRPAVMPVENIKISPMLSVRNGARAVEFYKAAFGARELFRLDGEGGSVVAELAAGDASFWVADESPEHSNFSPQTLGGGSVRMIVVVEDPDAVFARGSGRGTRGLPC